MPVYTEPTWPETSQEAVDGCSSLVNTGPSGFLLTGILTKLIQYQFSDPDNIATPKLKCYRWYTDNACSDNSGGSENPDGSGIWIGPGYSDDNEGIQASPAIYVNRGGIRTSQISQKNISVAGVDVNSRFQGTQYQRNIEGVHNIICKGKGGAVADALGEEVFNRFLHFQGVIRDDFRLGRFEVTSLSEIKDIAKDQEADSGFYTVVRIEWAYVYRWVVRQEAPKLKRTHLLYELC